MKDNSLRPAAGYIRESTKMQRQGFGADVQRAGISDYAPPQGYQITLWEDDTKRGHITDREGYQRIRAAARAGTIEAVFVYMFDRAGRDAVEFVQFADELERLRVPLYSVTQGKLGGDGMSLIHAFMARTEVITLARRVRPAKERSVRAGQHIGITPFGYKRVYPEHVGASRYVPGVLTPDEPAASIVRELFDRAAVGSPLRELAMWMNTNPECPRPPRADAWTADRVGYMLHNPAYYGHIRYNAHSLGRYDRCEPGSEFVCEGRHDALVSKEVFDRVQERLSAALKRVTRARLPGPLPLAVGLLVCAGCGGPMTTVRRRDGTHADQYACSHKKMGAASCQSVGYLVSLAHDALLAQVARLQGSPWEPQALDRVREADPTSEERARLQAELRDARAEQARHVRRFTALIDDPTESEVAVHRTVGREIQARIDALEHALAALPIVALTDRDLRTLHHELAHMALGDVVGALAAAGDVVALRALLLKLVARVKVIDRVPANRSRWLRAEVTWAPNVQLLLDAGLLTLAPDVARPDYPENSIDARRARQRAYYHRTKARAR